jgi:hypothetical protein
MIRNCGRWQMSKTPWERATACVPVPILPYCQSKNGSRWVDSDVEQVRRRQSLDGTRSERFIP